jgi:hypothetical protein
MEVDYFNSVIFFSQYSRNRHTRKKFAQLFLLSLGQWAISEAFRHEWDISTRVYEARYARRNHPCCQGVH